MIDRHLYFIPNHQGSVTADELAGQVIDRHLLRLTQWIAEHYADELAGQVIDRHLRATKAST